VNNEIDLNHIIIRLTL